VIKFSVLLKALMSFPNRHHQLIILCLLSFALCCYFIYISRNISPDKFFSIIYRQCYSSFPPTIHWSYKSSISYNKQLINSFIKYLFDTCDEISYLFTINTFYRVLSFINFLIFLISLWFISKHFF
jgi:hypothetical protein